MAVKSYLKQDDIAFLTSIVKDITNELCECDCCKKEIGCSIFERVYIASNLLYKKVYEDANSHTWTSSSDNVKSLEFIYDAVNPIYRTHPINMFDDESCIDWDTISSRINANSATKRKFVDKSRKKILSRFYKFLYDSLVVTISASDIDHVALSRDIFGSNVDDVINNCLDECCNGND